MLEKHHKYFATPKFIGNKWPGTITPFFIQFTLKLWRLVVKNGWRIFILIPRAKFMGYPSPMCE